jgi:hypothetical protein
VHDRGEDRLGHRVFLEVAAGEAVLVEAEAQRRGDHVRLRCLVSGGEERGVYVADRSSGGTRNDQPVAGARRDAEQVGQAATLRGRTLLIVRQRRHHREVQAHLGQSRVLAASLAGTVEPAR